MAADHYDSHHQAAIYASTTHDSTTSVKNQLDATRAYAEQNGLHIVRAYVDLQQERNHLLQMMTDAALPDPPFQKVLVSELSRISRRADEMNQIWTVLVDNGVELISLAQSEAGNIAASIGQYLYSQRSSRVRQGMRAAAELGFYVFSRAPYGYHKVAVWHQGIRRFKLEPNPPDSEAVRWIFDLRLQGASEAEIAAELNARRVRTPTVGRWRSRDVRHILGNETCCGSSLGPGPDIENPETVVCAPNSFPAIVSQEEFNLVQGMQ